MSDGESKPEPKAEGQALTVVIKAADGSEVQFKIKSTTKFERIFKAYSDKKAQDLSTLRFFFDGTRINNSVTPADLDMEDGDVVDCQIEQMGGAR